MDKIAFERHHKSQYTSKPSSQITVIDRFIKMDLEFIKMQMNVSRILSVPSSDLLKMDIVNFFQLAREAQKIQREQMNRQ